MRTFEASRGQTRYPSGFQSDVVYRPMERCTLRGNAAARCMSPFAAAEHKLTSSDPGGKSPLKSGQQKVEYVLARHLVFGSANRVLMFAGKGDRHRVVHALAVSCPIFTEPVPFSCCGEEPAKLSVTGRVSSEKI